MVTQEEMAASILKPHFDAVKDVFVAFSPSDGQVLDKLAKTKLMVDLEVRNSERHYAACRDDGLLIYLAPQAVDLPLDTLVAMLCHEFGHAADHVYPGRWEALRDQPAQWIEDQDSRFAQKARKLWSQRNRDQIEWAADSVAFAVIGKKIGYCGDCMLQCFAGGASRPKGLR